MIKVGVIGFGYWGPNVVRNLSTIDGLEVHSICDLDAEALGRARKLYPRVKMTSDIKDVVDSTEIDAVAIVTPVSTHYSLAKRALKNGKHVFVEKPFTAKAAQAAELIELARKSNLIIMVDHTFLFTPAVRKIKELVDNNVLGDLYYYDSTRISLGLFQRDVNVIWDLAPHDLSIIDYLIKSKPTAVSAQGIDHFNRGYENIAYITVYFSDQLIAHINANWLSPVKVRNILIGGQKKMLVWDDLEVDEKIKIYDRGVNVEGKEGVYKRLVEYRSGDMISPKLESGEALTRELKYFKECITTKKVPFNDGHAGLRIVKLLEAADKSLRSKGKIISIES